jgi:lysophospholipase L1-like esterase
MAEEEHVIYLDIHSLLLEEGEKAVKAYLMDDGVHVSDKGYSVWSGEIEKYL